MLKITRVASSDQGVTKQLDGRVAGSWVKPRSARRNKAIEFEGEQSLCDVGY
jgi:hypothetical protein